ncbi:phenylacetate--CoA ligase family protein [Arenibacter algicola]|uniref:phenylacetate--CoA ligase family protein n=1 Tax=Arenibacter algicola TaxID=616991 RepID=UPI001C07B37B|nr:phenylacetate--CoA ligase family protein [Arenibacter algicola]MBU2907273.1 phenylacetate--CoA ligase family protein [Arenibacter algicola]
MLKKVLFKFGVLLRNPSLENYLLFLKESDHWTEEKLVDYQINKCKEFLEFAYKYSPFYKEIFDKNGFKPAEFCDLKQLNRLPAISKEELIKYNQEIQSNYQFKKLFVASTSGTSGQLLRFLKNEEWDSHTRAAIFRGYTWYNVKPWDRNGYLWGYNIDPKAARKIKLLDWLQNRFRLYTYKSKEIENFARKLKGAKYLHGYSSVIYEVAKLVNKSGLKIPHNLKMIKGTSEKVYDSYQEEVKKAFGLKMLIEYGASESGLIGFECPQGSIHIAMENVIIEEEDGEILVTNLLSRSFPIIRYKLGDSIKLADSEFKCSCGRSHAVILDIHGRLGEKIIGKTREFPSVLLNIFFKGITKNHGILLNYQLRQNFKGLVDIDIEQEEHGNGPILEKELKNYFKDDIEFTIRYGQHLHKMDGKLKNFITTLKD